MEKLVDAGTEPFVRIDVGEKTEPVNEKVETKDNYKDDSQVETKDNLKEDTKEEKEGGKYRRLFEKTQKELEVLKADAEKRKNAELSDYEKLQKRAEEAEKLAHDLSRERLISKIAKEEGISEDSFDFLTASDEEGLRNQAQKLASITKRTNIAAGTRTNPAANQQPSIDEQISAAEKSSNSFESIRLKVQKAKN